jgi:DNA-directed RNA polymerase alpha subunit
MNLFRASESPAESIYMTCKKSIILNNRNFYSCFHVGPFNAGQSLTVANALRRTLLSELNGVAIIALEIEGVLHEYSNIIGVKDTVLDITLNLKEIVLKTNLKTNFTHGFGFIQVRGPGVVRACDIKLPSFLLCVDPNQYIATLSYEGSISIKLHISTSLTFFRIKNVTPPSGKNKRGRTPVSRSETAPRVAEGRGKLKDLASRVRDTAGRQPLPNKAAWETTLLPWGGRTQSPKGVLCRRLSKGLISQLHRNYVPSALKSRILGYQRNGLKDFNGRLRASASAFARRAKAASYFSQTENPSLASRDVMQPLQGKALQLCCAPSGHTKSPWLSEQGWEGRTRMRQKSSEILSIDPVFNSVTKVNYSIVKNVQDFYSTSRKDTQILVLEIWTNGSISPRKALNFALKKLIQIFYNIKTIKLFDSTLRSNKTYTKMINVFSIRAQALKATEKALSI